MDILISSKFFLKSPHTAIPKGTILSVILTSFIYLLFAWICGATVLREATGLLNTLFLVNFSFHLGKLFFCIGNVDEIINGTFAICANANCTYGLLNDYQVMEMVSFYGPLITAGIFSASLSSALASLVSAPKIFQVRNNKKNNILTFFMKF